MPKPIIVYVYAPVGSMYNCSYTCRNWFSNSCSQSCCYFQSLQPLLYHIQSAIYSNHVYSCLESFQIISTVVLIPGASSDLFVKLGFEISLLPGKSWIVSGWQSLYLRQDKLSVQEDKIRINKYCNPHTHFYLCYCNK